MSKLNGRYYQRIFFLFFIILIFSGCQFFKTLINSGKIQKPHVLVQSVKLTGWSFRSVDLLFNFEIQNPNSFEINLDGWDYQLKINSQTFLQGQEKQKIQIAAEKNTYIQLPLTIRLIELYQTFHHLVAADSVNYVLECGFLFRIPLFGRIRIPTKQSGSFPMLKIPSIQMGSFKLKRLDFAHADFFRKRRGFKL